ncbi:RNA polymerase factor sigma-70 [Pseudomonas syringae pv. actinidiae]|nr:RNA polymerase factor sigma-70 [Pseudomonas syringae pv. actinidiae]
MTEHVITSKCESPLLQAFVDNYLLLVKIAARIVGCRSRAEDVVQDAFFRLRSAPQATLTFKAQLSYLFQIVRNLAIDHYRKQALEQKYTGPEAEGLNVVIQGASPEISHINFTSLEKSPTPERVAAPHSLRDSKKTKVQARYSFLYHRIGNEWKILNHHSSAMPEIQPEYQVSR